MGMDKGMNWLMPLLFYVIAAVFICRHPVVSIIILVGAVVWLSVVIFKEFED